MVTTRTIKFEKKTLQQVEDVTKPLTQEEQEALGWKANGKEIEKDLRQGLAAINDLMSFEEDVDERN